MSRYASSAASVLLGAVLAAVAFTATGGFQLDRVTWTEISLVLASGLLVAVALLRAPGGRLHGGLTLGTFAGLTVLVAVSIAWSSAPNDSWLAANLTITYLFVFAAAVALARVRPDGWTIVLRGILLAAAAIVIYALGTRVWPSDNATDIFARLGEPYRYWNALGATAALAVPPALWLGARRSGHPPANALAYPLLSLLVVTIFLSYSRAAIGVAAIGALLWIVFVPLRLRSITLLGFALAAAAPVIVWALQQDAFTKNGQPLAVREAVATEFGLFLIATVILSLGAGLAIGFGIARRPPRAPMRLRVGLAAGLVAVAVPIALTVVLVTSDRGLTGTIKEGYESLTSTDRKTGSGPGRLLSASSARGLYWGQAREVFDSHYWKGTGANSFGVARLRFREPDDQSVSQHAHGYVHQTAADLGTAGLLTSLVLLLAWLVAAGRTVGLLRRRRHGPLRWTPERVGLSALTLSAVVYGLHSAVDWIWFVPGPTVMALVGAGLVAGRGPAVREPEPEEAVVAAPVVVRTAVAAGGPPPPPPPAEGNGASEAPTQLLPPPPPPPPPPPERARRRLPGLPQPVRRALRPLLALFAVAAALICAFAIWQPLRSEQEADRALDLSAEGRFPQALAAADRAHDYDPLTARPYTIRSTIHEAAGRPDEAREALEQAVIEFPSDPQTWIQLAQFHLNALNQPADALAIIKGALYLDPQSRAAQTVFLQATAALRPQAPPPPAAQPPATPESPPPSP